VALFFCSLGGDPPLSDGGFRSLLKETELILSWRCKDLDPI